MSHDISLVHDFGAGEIEVGNLDWNYTRNVSPMWRLAMPHTDGLNGLHGKLAGDAAIVLEDGIAAMESDPDAYRALNPPNGWGDFDSQLERLKVLLGEFRKAPDATVRVDA